MSNLLKTSHKSIKTDLVDLDKEVLEQISGGHNEVAVTAYDDPETKQLSFKVDEA